MSLFQAKQSFVIFDIASDALPDAAHISQTEPCNSLVMLDPTAITDLGTKSGQTWLVLIDNPFQQ